MDNSADQSQMCSNVLFGLALFLLSGFLPCLLCEKCTTEEAIVEAQHTCKQSNEAIIEAKDSGNTTWVCSNFFLFLKCVAANSSRCFNEVFIMMQEYFDSPYHCTHTVELTLELQQLMEKGLSSPTTHETTEVRSQPTTVDYTEVTENTFITSTGNAEHGSKGEQKGPHNSSTTVMFIGLHSLVIVFISSVLPWLQLS
ncbi:unnamed protein product [Lymnaea stagnalis]|uniref:Uncharacterized protein n=1 Tax=Lymnaea stagnalis TaxID=6523 RepID=A0AAV2HTW6_LYMST